MKILFVNKQMCKVTGYKPEEVVGRQVTLLMPDDIAKNHQSYVSRLRVYDMAIRITSFVCMYR